MKKTIITSMALASLAAGVLLYSCKKQETILPQSPPQDLTSSVDASMAPEQSAGTFNVSVTNNRLVFSSVAEYRKVVENPTAEISQGFLAYINQLQFTSLQKQYSTQSDTATTKIYDEYFRAILNPDRVVQIGSYIFRINPTKEKVFMLPSVYSSQYAALLAENTANPYIRVYSIGDDVLDVISGASLVCKETGISNKHSYLQGTTYELPFKPPVNTYFTAKIKFERYGIYFTLYSRMDGKPSNLNYNYSLVYFKLHFSVYYHARCGKTVGQPYGQLITKDSVYAGNGPALKYQSYQGSRNLNKLWVKSRWGINSKTDTPPLLIFMPYTDWKEIRVNI